MKVQLSSDIINILPKDIIERILSHLPIKDAVRTSILSSKWRYSWTRIPTLAFDDNSFEVSSNNGQIKKYKFVNAIFHALLFHKGPLLEFFLSIREPNMASETDQIISYLSVSNTLEFFILRNDMHQQYKLPSSFFSLKRLKHLGLRHCVIDPPLTFNGFSRLRTLCFWQVWITAKMLQRFLLGCPVLETLVLEECRGDFREGNKFTFVELFECLPFIVHVHITDYYVEYLAAGGMPPKLPTSLVHLNAIYLNVCFMKEDECSSLLCLIRSSPNIKKIDILTRDDGTLVEQSSKNFFVLEDHSSCKLNHLEDLKIGNFKNLLVEMEFVKFIMARSPVLKKVQIMLNSSVSVDEELKMFRDLVRDSIPRASPSAKLIIKR